MSEQASDFDKSQDISSSLPTSDLHSSNVSLQDIPPKAERLPIAVLNLSSNITRTLTRTAINTIGDLVTARSRGLGQIRWIGEKSIAEIENALVQFFATSQSLTDEDLEQLDTRPYKELLKEEIFRQVAGLPISLLKLSSRATRPLARLDVNTIGDLIAPESVALERVRRLGEKPISEIENALVQLLNDYRSVMGKNPEIAKAIDEMRINDSKLLPLSHSIDNVSKLEYILDSTPPLIEIDGDVVNLLKIITPLSKALMESLGHIREFEVIKRRYGLQNSKMYTLQEVGDYYDITRERVRQIESRAMKKIQRAIFGIFRSKHWHVPEVVIKEAKELSTILISDDGLISESEIVRMFEERYNTNLSAKETNILRFTLNILDIDLISKVIPGFSGELSSIWISSKKIDIRSLQEILKYIYIILKENVIPISFFELKLEVSRRFKRRIDIDQAIMTAKLCKEIEVIDRDIFQMRIEFLPSVADKAHRILYDSKQQLHLRDIVRQMNYNLARAGFPANVRVRTLQQQLVIDSRFEPVGRSGMWILSEWEDISRDSIVQLMKEFFHLKQNRASPAEIFKYVHEKRADISKKSVYAYLQTEIFIRVASNSYELAEWGGKPEKQAKRLDENEIQELLTSGIKTVFSSKATNSLPLSELVRELIKITGIPSSTVYMKVVRSPFLEFENISARSRAKMAKYIGDSYVEQGKKAPKKTINEAVRQEIIRYLLKQPERRALISDVAIHVIKVTKCKKPTFYLYLSRMENITKEYDGRKAYCRMVVDNPDKSLLFPQIEQIDDSILKDDLYRAIKNLNIDNVDLGLFQLGKIFENELKEYLLEAQKKRAFSISSKDLERLVSMIDCVERNGIIKTKHHLTLLREHRNERAHGKIPNTEEREKLMQHAPFLADLYIQYIAFFREKRNKL